MIKILLEFVDGFRTLRRFPTLSAMAVFTSVICMVFVCPAVAEEIRAEFLYKLSGFTGAVAYNWVNLSVDKSADEVYVCDPTSGVVRVYNMNGMEVYHFGDDRGYFINHVAVDEKNGDILALVATAKSYRIIRCDFRGDPLMDIVVSGLPQDFYPFNPSSIFYRNGKIYLCDQGGMKVAVISGEGKILEIYDIGTILEMTADEIRDCGMGGVYVDDKGDILFTISTHFRAYILSPDRKIKVFGSKGSNPGKFNIVTGIAADSRGNIYVVDTLRSVVIVFDRALRFKTEFGFRGDQPENLVVPRGIEIDARDRVFVTQGAGRGVNVYKMIFEQPGASIPPSEEVTNGK